jgi:hypothetical protein
VCDDAVVGLLPYVLALGAALAVVGGLLLFAFAGLNLAHAGGDAESPELNVAFGALLIVAGSALLGIGGLAGWLALRLRHGEGS